MIGFPEHRPCPTCGTCPTCGNRPAWPQLGSPFWYGGTTTTTTEFPTYARFDLTEQHKITCNCKEGCVECKNPQTP